MRTAGSSNIPAGMMVAAGTLLLAGCATMNRPQQFRTFLVPPPIVKVAANEPVPEPPRLTASLYANEMPFLAIAPPDIPRPTDTDFLLKKANDAFATGKADLQAGNYDEARKQFDLSVQTLLGAPDTVPEHQRLERRLEELIDAIYKMDVDQANAEEADDRQPSYDKSPLDGVLDMTFPVDPALRSKIREQIQATASQLPLEESDAVIGAINFFSTDRGKKIVAAGIRRSGRYKAMIERILAEEGLPQELIFVAQAESGFLPRALSNKACVGLWQFAKFRGKEYGLEQTASTDDRMDPEKATRAAAKHLHDLYTHFGDWYLALAAYDCGPGCVDHAIMRTGYADFWELRRRNVFVTETQNYVPVILAMIIMSKNAKDYGLDNLDMDPPLEYDTIELESPTHVALVADAVGRSVSELRDLNPSLIRSVAPAGFAMHVPKGTLPELESAFAVIPETKRDSWRIHRVEPGDTLGGLAKRYSASTTLLSEANREEMAAPGGWMAIPVAYPGDRTVSHKTTSRAASKTASRKRTGSAGHAREGAIVASRGASGEKTGSTPGMSRTAASHTASKTSKRKSTAVAHRSSKPPAHHAPAVAPAG